MSPSDCFDDYKKKGQARGLPGITHTLAVKGQAATSSLASETSS